MFDFSEFPILETERLRLRAVRASDLDAAHAIFGDAETCRYLTDQNCAPYPDRATTQREIIDWCLRHFVERRGLRWAITLRDGDDTLIGTAGINWWDRANHCAEIGYDLNRAYWGQGIMPEAVRAILRWAFAAMDLHRIEATTTAGNTGSARVLAKCGFIHEGTARERHHAQGRYWDNRRFGLLRAEFVG